MTQSVTMPDGTIHNFPDEATQDMISSALGLQSQYATDPIRSAYQTTMNNVAKPINSAVNSVVSPIMGGIASAESKPAQNIADAIDSTGAGQWVGDRLLDAKNELTGAGDNIKDLESYNPDLEKDLSAFGQNAQLAGNITPIASTAKFAGKIGDAVEPTLSKAPGILGDVSSGSQKINASSPVTSSSVKNASQNAYKYAENVGGVLHPDNFTNPVLDIIDAAKAKPIAGKVLTSEQRALNSALDEYAPLRDSPLTLDDFQNFDKSLTAKESSAMDGFKPTNNSRIIGQVQDQIRDRLQNLDQSDVIGGKEGFDALTQHAIPLWSAQTKMADLENIINRANTMDNSTTAMRYGFRNLANSPKFDAYPEDVQALILKATKNPSDMLGIIGSRLNPIMDSTLAGKATNMATSAAARGLRNYLQNSKADKILSAMTEPVRDSVEKFSTLPESPYPLKPEVPIAPENPYINSNAKTLDKFSQNSDLNLTGNKPEVPIANQYFNVESKQIPKLSSGEQAIKALENIGGKDPELPDPQGTTSQYFKHGGAVKPTAAQIAAGNYKKEKINFQGLPISIENQKDSIRSGKDKNGKEWHCKMPCAYGYIRETIGADKEHIDCFVGPNPKSLRVYVINQKHYDSGKFDEHKVMLGFKDRESALSAYRSSFSDNKNRIMHVKKLLMSEFKQWLNTGNNKKPIKVDTSNDDFSGAHIHD